MRLVDSTGKTIYVLCIDPQGNEPTQGGTFSIGEATWARGERTYVVNTPAAMSLAQNFGKYAQGNNGASFGDLYRQFDIDPPKTGGGIDVAPAQAALNLATWSLTSEVDVRNSSIKGSLFNKSKTEAAQQLAIKMVEFAKANPVDAPDLSEARAAYVKLEQQARTESSGELRIPVTITGLGDSDLLTLKVEGKPDSVQIVKSDGSVVENGSTISANENLTVVVPAGESAGQLQVGAMSRVSGGVMPAGTILWPSNTVAQRVLTMKDVDNVDSTAEAQITVKWPRTEVPEEPVGPGNIGTTVKVGEQQGAQDRPVMLEAGQVNVKDVINYSGLKEGENYDIVATLREVDGNNAEKIVDTERVTRTADTADGKWEIDFGQVNLEAGKKYVVFETATSQNAFLHKVSQDAEAQNAKQELRHENAQDQAQTIVVNSGPEAGPGKIGTVVNAGGQEGSADKEAVVAPGTINVQDTINYSGLKPNAVYDVTATLNKIVNGEAQAVQTVQDQKTANENGAGSWTVNFGEVQLEAGAKYVVFEEAVSQDSFKHVNTQNQTVTEKQTVVHKNVNDKAQAVVVGYPQGSLATQVNKNSVTAAEARAGVDVIDTISFTNLKPGETYNVTGELFKVVNGKKQGDAILSKTEQKVAETASGNWELNLGNTTALEPNTKYVVFETAVSENAFPHVNEEGEFSEGNQTVTHKDPSDPKQTVAVGETPVGPGEIRTTASAGTETSSQDAPATVDAGTVNVIDTIDYEGLKGGAEYKVEARLMKITDDAQVEVASKTETKTAAQSGSGKWTIDFGQQELEAGTKYVVFEKATSVESFLHTSVDENGEQGEETNGQQVLTHENPEDTAQTIVVREAPVGPGTIGTTVTAGEVEATDSEPTSVDAGTMVVTDTIAYAGLKAGEQYTVDARLMKIVEGQEPEQIAQKQEQFEAAEGGAGNWTVNFGEQSLEAGAKYVVFEKATSVNNIVHVPAEGEDNAGEEVNAPQVLTHENPDDVAQTIVVNEEPVAKGNLETSVNPKEVTAAQAGEGVNVVDTITYTNLKPGETYEVTGELFKVVGDQTKGTAILSNTENLEADASGNGTWTLNLGTTTELEPGTKYVVFETAVSTTEFRHIDENDQVVDGKQTVNHHEPTDAAQTITVGETPVGPGEIGTTVTSTQDGQESLGSETEAATAEAGEVTVKDTIAYSGLKADETYMVTGTLNKVENGAVVEAVKTLGPEERTASSTGRGTWEIDFGSVTLEPGATYVVYEKAVSKTEFLHQVAANQPNAGETITGTQNLSHENPEDLAQTIVVGETPAGPGELKTSAAPKNVTAAEGAAGVAVQDTITYRGLVPNQDYTMSGELWKVEGNETAGDAPVATANATLTASPEGEGTWTINFESVALEAGAKYVVFETAASTEPVRHVTEEGGQPVTDIQRVEHRDPTDEAQTVTVGETEPETGAGELQTTVTAGEVTAAEGAPAQVEAGTVTVTDTIAYSDLKPGETYTVVGRLMEIGEDGAATEVKKVESQEVAAGEDAGNGSGTWTIEFGEVALKAGAKYVVFEEATSATAFKHTNASGEIVTENQVVTHADVDDQAQTIVVNEEPVGKGDLATSVNPKTVTAAEAAEGVTVVDTIKYTNLKPGETFTVTGELFKVVDDEVEGSAILTKTDELVADESGNGEWKLELGSTSDLEPGAKYVVFETAESATAFRHVNENDEVVEGKQTVEHKDPTDEAQTVTVGEEPEVPGTTEPSESTETTPVEPTEPSETPVEPTGTTETEEPSEPSEPTGTTETTPVEPTEPTEPTETPEGAIDTTEPSTPAEQPVGPGKVETEADPQDVAAVDAEGAKIKDKISYSGLKPGETYAVTGELFKVVDGKTVGEPVAKKTEDFTASDSGKGEWTLEFEPVDLEADTKYVVFETAVSKSMFEHVNEEGETATDNQTVKHHDPKDEAQTVTVGKPEEPTSPEEPEGPTDTETPGTPTDTTEPSKPEVPGGGTDTTKPGKPDTEVPGKPSDKPGKPSEEPGNPGDKPGEPTTTTPGTPGGGNGENPGGGAGENPGAGSGSGNGQGAGQGNGNGQGQGQGDLANTGVSGVGAVLGVAMMLLLAGAGILFGTRNRWES